MSWQLNSQFSIATLSAMVSLISTIQVAQAATVGATQINSGQNEPLAASIKISNIDANNFSASVASNSVYKQMEMSTNVPVNVQFIKTSDTSGKLVLTSSQPVSEPFADVVLVLDENGNQQQLPKTLLLPIRSTATVNQKKSVMVGNSSKPNLPVVSLPNTANTNNNVLTVEDNLPPAMLDNNVKNSVTKNIKIEETRKISPVRAASNRSPIVSGFAEPNNSYPNKSLAQGNSSSVIDTTPIIKAPTLNNVATTDSMPTTITAQTIPENITGNKPIVANDDTDLQSDILTTEITKRYKLSSGEVNVTQIVPDGIKNSNASAKPHNFKPLIPAPALVPSPTGVEENMIEAAIVRAARTDPNGKVVNVNTPETILKADKEAIQKNRNNKNTPSATNTDIGVSTSTYTVQRNDNLWTIANQIARRNRVDVNTVMRQIQNYNKDAFIDGNPGLLKVNTKLALPDYDVIPSRLGIKAALSAKKSSKSRTSSKSSTKPSKRATPKRPHIKAKTYTKKKPSKGKVSRPLPKPDVRLVTPGSSGSATGSGSNRTGSNGLSNTLAAKIKTTRQQTAKEARRVSGLNSQLSDYTRKLQLQNQKLSDLELRLRELREK